MRRKGFTLIELLLVLSCSGVVLVTAVGLVATAMKTQRHSRKQLELDQTYMRLARFIRDDLATASAAEVSVDQDQLSIRGLQAITYSVNDDQITRVLVRADETVAAEQFDCAEGARVTFAMSDRDLLVSVVIQRDVIGRAQPRLECHLQCRVGSRSESATLKGDANE